MGPEARVLITKILVLVTNRLDVPGIIFQVTRKISQSIQKILILFVHIFEFSSGLFSKKMILEGNHDYNIQKHMGNLLKRPNAPSHIFLQFRANQWEVFPRNGHLNPVYFLPEVHLFVFGLSETNQMKCVTCNISDSFLNNFLQFYSFLLLLCRCQFCRSFCSFR